MTVPDLPWCKSSASLTNGTCVEVAQAPGEVLVRDSKNPDRAPLIFTAEEWSAFLRGVKAGEFDVG